MSEGELQHPKFRLKQTLPTNERILKAESKANIHDTERTLAAEEQAFTTNDRTVTAEVQTPKAESKANIHDKEKTFAAEEQTFRAKEQTFTTNERTLKAEEQSSRQRETIGS